MTFQKGNPYRFKEGHSLGVRFQNGSIPWNKGVKMTYQHGMSGKKHTRETIEKMRKVKTGKKVSEETLKKMRASQGKRTKAAIKKMLRKHGKSTLEIKFESIVKKHNLPYKFVGNGEVIIGRKCPDFINTNGEKIAIEVYYKKHKERFRAGLDKWMEDRKAVFKKYGWDILFFDETMVNESDVIKAIL